MSTRTGNRADHTAEHRPKHYGRWRAATLASVYVLMGVHIAHWKIAGKTLAPLELNEVMYTLELGIVTAGFIFMAAATLSVLIFGRFFCSWGCHILALEDLCAWLLDKIRIHPKPVRARSLLLVPPATMFYMFLWPQVSRIIEGRDLPGFHVTGDASGWASFLTSDFSRNLPGPGIIVLTFLIVGFVIVYILGTRSFCRYVCPYGAVFALVDRIAPGRIVARADCSGCGLCTARCQSHIRVHEELTVYGQIVNPSCLKDLECIANCPDGNIGYGFRRPPFFKSWKRVPGIKRPRYNFTLAEEGLMVVVFLIALFTFRGLYGLFPFLLTLSFGGIMAYGAVLCVRLARNQNVRLNNFRFKRAGSMTRSGVIFVGVALLITTLTAHSAFIRYHEYIGWRAVQQLEHSAEASVDNLSTMETAVAHLSITRQQGLYTAPALDDTLKELHISLAEGLAERDDLAEAIDRLADSVELYPESALIRYNLGVMLAKAGRDSEAMNEYRAALRIDPSDPDAWNNFGFLLAKHDYFDDAERCFRTAIERNPEFAHPHFNMALVLVQRGRMEEAEFHLRRAAELDPATYARFVPEKRDPL